MIEKAFFLRRLNDHTQYLNKINATLHGNGSFTGTNACGCKLGSWLCGKGKQDIAYYGKEPLGIFLELDKKHRRFHDVSNTVLNKHLTNTSTQKSQAFTQMHLLSTHLINLLLDLDAITTQREQKTAA